MFTFTLVKVTFALAFAAVLSAVTWASYLPCLWLKARESGAVRADWRGLLAFWSLLNVPAAVVYVWMALHFFPV